MCIRDRPQCARPEPAAIERGRPAARPGANAEAAGHDLRPRAEPAARGRLVRLLLPTAATTQAGAVARAQAARGGGWRVHARGARRADEGMPCWQRDAGHDATTQGEDR
eukprot:5290734-Prymnesium_polylepis.1